MRDATSNSDRLIHFSRLLQKTVLNHQNLETGLFPPNPGNPHAWIRDNVYTSLSIWALSKAYGKNTEIEDFILKRTQLEECVIKTLRGLLGSMIAQREKLERFKHSQKSMDAIHAKYCVSTGRPVHGDFDWGHLQLDAISVFLLVLAQMSVSGLRIVQTREEVAFVQNLVFYIESAHRIPDYGIWERGDKRNHGVTELNASSIGMAKAALETIDQVNLFGSEGGPASIIHASPDELQRCDSLLTNMLPRESNSKETDAALLLVIGYPAFAVCDVDLIKETKSAVISKLEGPYGLSRFLRDGFGTVLEDPNRLHYESWELETFENIESEWPLFWAVLVIEGFFVDDQAQIDKYWNLLRKVMLPSPEGLVMPELYVVPEEKIHEEKITPKSTMRVPAGKIPHLWGQSLFIVASLLKEQLLSPVDLDPLNRRLVSAKKPDVTVQVAFLAKTQSIQELLGRHGYKVETAEELNDSVTVLPAQKLSNVYAHQGCDPAHALTGRSPSNHPIGVIATSKFYSIKQRLFAFTPRLADHESFYLAADADLLADMLLSRISRLSLEWGSRKGNPTVIFVVDSLMMVPVIEKTQMPSDPERGFEWDISPTLLSTLKKLESGFVQRARVVFDRLSTFVKEASVTNWTFLCNSSDSPNDIEEEVLAELLMGEQLVSPLLPDSVSPTRSSGNDDPKALKSPPRSGDNLADIEWNFAGLIKRNRSLQWTPNTLVTEFPNVALTCKDSSDRDSLSVCQEEDAMWKRRTSSGRFPISPSSISNLSAPSAESMLIGSPSSKFHYERRNQEIHHRFSADQVVAALLETDDITQQAEFLHYLAEKKGLEWHVGVKDVTVKDLLSEVYDRGCERGLWWLVRHTSGLLRRSVVDLGRCISSIVIRQKQVTFGYPSNLDQRLAPITKYGAERVVTSPLPPNEILNLIYSACGCDYSLASITQEILIYLATYIETQPSLFVQMLRIRIGLIIQTMIAELSLALSDNQTNSIGRAIARHPGSQGVEEEALEHLLNLSPLEVKTLLFYVLSGKEFGLSALLKRRDGLTRTESVSIVKPKRSKKTQAIDLSRRLSRQNSVSKLSSRSRSHPPRTGRSRSFPSKSSRDSWTSPSSPFGANTAAGFFPGEEDVDEEEEEEKELNTTLMNVFVDSEEAPSLVTAEDRGSDDGDGEGDDEVDFSGRFGFWLRRRRIDGSLNRVPVGFYERIWRLLHDKARGPSELALLGNCISSSLTQEMTESEMNFALAVEERLNLISHPEFRQLFVEAIIILTSIYENLPKDVIPGVQGKVLHVEHMVLRANAIFLQEQNLPVDARSHEHTVNGVSIYFFDLAPSGEYGTMTYLTRSIMEMIQLPPNLECTVQ